MPRPEVVLFDVDGTLVDHDRALREALIRWLTGNRLATEEQCKDGLVAVWDQTAERHFPAFRARQITFQEQRRRRLRDFLPHLGIQAEQLDAHALDAVFEDYLRHYEAAWRAYDDVAPCLLALRGFRVAVLSNGDQAQQEDKLRRTGLHSHFEAVLTSGALGAAKPYPEAYRLACDQLGVEPADVAYVGDRLDIDAQASTAAGLQGVWLDRDGGNEDRFQPTINSLLALPELIGQASSQ